VPQVIVEYSNNLVSHKAFEPAKLVKAINQVLLESKVFQENDIKTLAHGNDVFAVGGPHANDKAEQAFIFCKVYILAGRSAEIKQQLKQATMQVLREQVKPVAGLEIQASADINDMERDLFMKETF
jgi:5-carboxymethyl-2-hydroxymuconate isomerase